MEIEEPLALDPGRGEYYVFDVTEGAVLQVAVNADASVEISLSDGSEAFEKPSIGRKFFAVTSSRATCQFGAPYTGTLLLSLLNTDLIPATGSVVLKTKSGHRGHSE